MRAAMARPRASCDGRITTSAAIRVRERKGDELPIFAGEVSGKRRREGRSPRPHTAGRGLAVRSSLRDGQLPAAPGVAGQAEAEGSRQGQAGGLGRYLNDLVLGRGV